MTTDDGARFVIGRARLDQRRDPMAPLGEFIASAGVDEAARQRRARHWQAQIARESSDFAGVLGECADRGDQVDINAGVLSITGSLAELGADFVTVVVERGHWYVVLHAITALRTMPGAPTHDRARAANGPQLDDRPGLFDRLADWVREPITVVTAAGSTAGELASYGRDYLQLRAPGPLECWHYVPAAAIVAVCIPGGGSV